MTKTTSKPKEPGLYGLNHGNFHRKGGDMWGKNCFNSSFPASLACYMRDNGHSPVLIRTSGVDEEVVQFENKEISVDEVFNSSLPNKDLRFLFESKFDPYACYDHAGNEMDKADLVIKDKNDNWLRQFQVKLAVTPDNNTSKRVEDEWSPELVLRPADTCLCALGMFHTIIASLGEGGAGKIKKLFHDTCYNLNWQTLNDSKQQQQKIKENVTEFIGEFCEHQTPFLLNPIWKTAGMSPHLADDNALDIFIWSDHALISACLNKATPGSRGFRATARFARAMYELSQHKKIMLHAIYRHEMGMGKQTDKEMALSGLETQRYMTSPRRIRPLLPPNVLRDIILNGGHKKLSPERRFDQTIYFTATKIFGD